MQDPAQFGAIALVGQPRFLTLTGSHAQPDEKREWVNMCIGALWGPLSYYATTGSIRLGRRMRHLTLLSWVLEYGPYLTVPVPASLWPEPPSH